MLAAALCKVIKFTFTNDKQNNHFATAMERVNENDMWTNTAFSRLG